MGFTKALLKHPRYTSLNEDERGVLQRLNYIHQNPVRQLIVTNAHEYIFSSAIDYADGKGLVKVTVI